MFDSTSRLPARPSFQQLRKQAKELLRDYSDGDAVATNRIQAISPRLARPVEAEALTLADAQFVLARKYGFESWPKLVDHVESINPSDRLKRYERLVKDIVRVCCFDDPEALQRIADLPGRTYPYPDRRTRLQKQLVSLVITGKRYDECRKGSPSTQRDHLSTGDKL